MKEEKASATCKSLYKMLGYLPFLGPIDAIMV
jgi:hypothetical protein